MRTGTGRRKRARWRSAQDAKDRDARLRKLVAEMRMFRLKELSESREALFVSFCNSGKRISWVRDSKAKTCMCCLNGIALHEGRFATDDRLLILCRNCGDWLRVRVCEQFKQKSMQPQINETHQQSRQDVTQTVSGFQQLMCNAALIAQIESAAKSINQKEGSSSEFEELFGGPYNSLALLEFKGCRQLVIVLSWGKEQWIICARPMVEAHYRVLVEEYNQYCFRLVSYHRDSPDADVHGWFQEIGFSPPRLRVRIERAYAVHVKTLIAERRKRKRPLTKGSFIGKNSDPSPKVRRSGGNFLF